MASLDKKAKATQKYSYIIDGIALTLFGVAAIAWPGLTFVTFTVLFGLYAIVSGLVHVVSGIVSIKNGWKAIADIALGAVYIVAGSYVLNHPKVAAMTLVLILAFSFIFRGIVDVVVAFSEDSKRKALTIVGSFFAIIVGLVLLRHPVGGGLAYVWVLGVYALISGPILIAMGIDED